MVGFSAENAVAGERPFLDGMAALDRKLLAEGVPVPGRPLEAMRRTAISLGTELILGGSDRSPVADAIASWYSVRYGDRLAVDSSPGSAVILVRGDPLVMRLPLIVGGWDGILDLTKLVPGLTQPMFAELHPGEMEDLIGAFSWLRERFAAIERLPPQLISNLSAAIMQMTVQLPHHGESRWASLQFAEKALKHFIRSRARKPPFTHDLARLLGLCEAAGLPSGRRPLLATIQCDAGVRYSHARDLDGALAAHHASIDLAAFVAHHLDPAAPAEQSVVSGDLADLVLSFAFGIETSHDGDLLFRCTMADGGTRRILLAGVHCDWLVENLSGTIASGRHPDVRRQFDDGRDIRNAPPRHPLRLFHAHLPTFEDGAYEAECEQVEAIRAYDEKEHVVLELVRVGGAESRLILWSETIPLFVEALMNGIAEGVAGGLFGRRYR